MQRSVKPNLPKRTLIALSIAIGAFLIVYMGGAIHDAALRYASAAAISKSQAHTNVGKEGYEYIFEPNTQIFIDKILPNRNLIIANIVIEDYLPLDLNSDCRYLDKDICTWIRFSVLFPHDPTRVVLRLILLASIAALLAGGGYYLLSRLSKL